MIIGQLMSARDVRNITKRWKPSRILSLQEYGSFPKPKLFLFRCEKRIECAFPGSLCPENDIAFTRIELSPLFGFDEIVTQLSHLVLGDLTTELGGFENLLFVH